MKRLDCEEGDCHITGEFEFEGRSHKAGVLVHRVFEWFDSSKERFSSFVYVGLRSWVSAVVVGVGSWMWSGGTDYLMSTN